MSQANRRRLSRMSMAMRVRVDGHESQQPWSEMTTTSDVSRHGANFLLDHGVGFGHVLHLQMPMPEGLRSYDFKERSYAVYALVRSSVAKGGKFQTGVVFLGKQAPKGYDKDPSGVYLLPGDKPPAPRRTASSTGSERRTYQRLSVFLDLRLTRIDAPAGSVSFERTVSENISRKGALVRTSLPVTRDERLDVEEVEGTFRAKAEVVHVFIGKDGIPRLNLKFLEGEVPDRLLGG